MTNWQAWMACGLLMSLPAAAQADIFRWDNAQLIPGTEGITPGPGANLSDWSSPERNLGFADFTGLDLTEASFAYSWLDNSRFNGANLTNASLGAATLTNADLSGTNLTNARLGHFHCGGFVCVAAGAILTNANLAGAVVAGADFSSEFGGSGITLPQLYSTASYQQRNLRGIGLSSHDLTSGDFSGQDFTGADLGGSTLTNANLSGTNLTDAELWGATLTNASLAGAVVAGVNFFRGYGLEGSGITLPQLYSTASYQQRNLRGIGLSSHDLTSGDFSGQDLTGADLGGSTLTNANFAGAVVTFFKVYGSGITLPQLLSTASYQQRDLRGIHLNGDLTGGDFSGQDLTGADIGGSTLTNANLAGAIVTGARFGSTTRQGFTKEQLYSTASYQQRNLGSIGLSYNDLTGWDFSGQDLTGANLFESTLANSNLSGANLTNANLNYARLTNADLTGADARGSWLVDAQFNGANLTRANLSGARFQNVNLAGAVVAGANFGGTAGFGYGFTKEQLYSTASYQQRNLRGIGLSGNYLTGWNFGWDFSGQDLAGADFGGSTLTNANLAGAVVAGANFTNTLDFTKEQLYTTASYQQRDLRGIGLGVNHLGGWDFSGQDLAGADFGGSTLTNANFSFADLRGARMSSGPFQTRNTIREFGAINGLDLEAGETLVVRDSTIGITVNGSMNAVSGGTLELVLGDADWGSTMSVAAGVTPDLGGTLRVRFANHANLASMLGTTFDFFDWPAVLDINNRFDAIQLPPGTQWDFSQLYLTGTAKLTPIPEPSGDFNNDGTVDAADYIVWRNNDGTSEGYNTWRANFGQPSGSGAVASANATVPEPATLVMLFVSAGGIRLRRRHLGSRVPSTR